MALDLLFPPLDLVFTLAFLPGVVLACFGHFYLAGLMTLLVLPLTALIVLVMLRYQKGVFDLVGLRIRRNLLGFLAYFLVLPVHRFADLRRGLHPRAVEPRTTW